jgi:hypothetical protein
MRRPPIAAVIVATIFLPPALGDADAVAQPPVPRQERVTFAKGASSATVKGQVKGDETVDYVVRASAGQTLTVTLTPSNRSNYFNVLPPGSADVAMYAAQTGDPYKGMLPADGDYKVRVYLVRAAARRNESSAFTLSIGVSGKALVPLPATQDAVVPGTQYNAKASIQCVAMPYGDTTPKPCDAGVIRRGTDGTATVEVSLGTAGRRRILFVRGKPVASDSSGQMTSTRKGDTTVVTFESGERHEIPDAFVYGG